MPVITSPSFAINTDVSGDWLLEHEVDGLSDAPAKLLSLDRFDDKATNVITAIYLDINGHIKEIEIGVAGVIVSRKFPINKFFIDGPAGANLRLNKFNMSQFKFPPGLCYSQWISSDDLDWVVMKGNNLQLGTYPNTEYNDIGVTPWSCRLHVSTCEEANKAVVYLIAIPRLDLDNLPGTAAGTASEGYPGIMLGEFPAVMAGKPEEICGDYLPFYPVCINRGQADHDITLPMSEYLRMAMSTFWSGTTIPNTLTYDNWTAATEGPAEPDQTVVRSEWTWPPITIGEETEDVDSAEEMIGEPVPRRRILDRQARDLAASIAATHGLQQNTPSVSLSATSIARTSSSSTWSATTTTTTSSTPCLRSHNSHVGRSTIPLWTAASSLVLLKEDIREWEHVLLLLVGS